MSAGAYPPAVEKTSLLRPVKKTRVYEDVVAQIQRLIRTKKLSPGDRLPSERELAATLGIGRPSVREALRTLDSMGLIEVRSGQGAFLRDIGLGPYLATIRESLSFLLDVKEDAFLELWEVRQGLEEQIASLAAGRRKEKHLEKLRALAQEMSAEMDSPESFVRAGVAFHRTLAEAADNVVLLTVWEAISGLIEKSQRRIIGIPEQAGQAMAQHEALLEAVVSGDRGAARRAMREHMESEGGHLRSALSDRFQDTRNGKTPD